MKNIIQPFKLIGVGILCFMLTACEMSTILTPPPPPIDYTSQPLPRKMTGELDVEKLAKRQKAFAAYIQYLTQYYIAVELLYRSATDVDKNVNDNIIVAQCRVVKDLFNEITLPPPPKPDRNIATNEAIHLLFEHIRLLRKSIRENNDKMMKLKEQYKHCL